MAQAPTTRRKPSENPRGPRYKKPAPVVTNEQAELFRSLVEMPAKVRKATLLTPAQVAPIIARGVKTMEGDRIKQRKAIKAKAPINAASPVSLPYVPPTADEKEVRYLASDVMHYLDRVYGAVDRSFLRLVGGDDAKMRGFQSWMSMAPSSDPWTFCVQADGRPLSLAEAIATDRLTEDTIPLTLTEFSTRLGDAARRSLANEEKASVSRAAKKPKTPAGDRKNRWVKPGGPV